MDTNAILFKIFSLWEINPINNQKKFVCELWMMLEKLEKSPEIAIIAKEKYPEKLKIYEDRYPRFYEAM